MDSPYGRGGIGGSVFREQWFSGAQMPAFPIEVLATKIGSTSGDRSYESTRFGERPQHEYAPVLR